MDRSIKDLDKLDASSASLASPVGVSVGLCLRIAVGVAVAIVAVHLFRVVSLYGFGVNRLGVILGRFDLNAEGAIPSWFAGLLLAAAGALALVIARMKIHVRDRYRLHWLAMGLVLVYLSVDEGAEIHEMWRHYLGPYVDWSGLLYYTATVPNFIGAALVGLLFLPFAISLGHETLVRIVLAGALYVGGAVGVEMLGGAQHSALGVANLRYQLLVALEESLEMAGVLVLIAALADYLLRWTARPRVALTA